MSILASRSALWIGLGLAAACLPADHTIPKGAIFAVVRAEPGSIAASPIVSDDGWAISITRILSSVSLSSSAEDYAKGDCYPSDLTSALVDLQAEYTFQALALDAIRCRVLITPGYGAETLGPRVTADDAAPFRVPPDPPSGSMTTFTTPPHFRIVGVARRGAQTKRFDLLLAESFGGTLPSMEGLYAPHDVKVDVKSADRVFVDFFFAPVQLFRTSLARDAGSVRFDALAYADDHGDNNGVVSLEELRVLRISDVMAALGFTYEGTVFAVGPGGDSLEQYISAELAQAWRGTVRGDSPPAPP